jgi:hypothetical protein
MPNVIKMVKPGGLVGGTCGTQGSEEKCTLGKSKAKEPNGKRVRRREDNIGMDLKNIMDYIYLSQHRGQWQAPGSTVTDLHAP